MHGVGADGNVLEGDGEDMEEDDPYGDDGGVSEEHTDDELTREVVGPKKGGGKGPQEDNKKESRPVLTMWSTVLQEWETVP